MASSAVADTASKSMNDQRKEKQLQEARAAGTAAPEVDAATGKMINPHNPQFITHAPWYLNQGAASLSHQQAWNLKQPGSKDWYRRGVKGDVKTKFLKGACENCGATTHTKKECVERPRHVKAVHNGQNLMPDEYIEDLKLDYDGKRDRWNGFQADDYKQIQDEWERVEDSRRTAKAAEMEERAKLKEKLKGQKKLLKKKRKQRRRQLRRQAEGKDSDTDTGDSDTGDSDTDSDTDSDSDASDDEDLGEKMKDFDKSTAAVATKDDKLRTTTRNLRIREDTAKYLLNLDVNSAFYDPKSRSMRDDPLAHLKDDEKGAYRGDNFVRNAGDAKSLLELSCFAWDAYKHGEKVHDVALPTQASKMHQVYKDRAKTLEGQKQKELIEKYGGEEHMDAPKELLFAQNENYVEYTRDGRVLKGRERAFAKSKYEEDVLVGNHASGWGTWYDTGSHTWGFACCHQTMKNAYCIPIAGNSAKAVEDGGEGVAEAPAEAEAGNATPDPAKAAEATQVAREAAAGAALPEGEDSDSSGSDSSSSSKKADEDKKLEKRKARALKGLKLVGEAQAAASTAPAEAAAPEEPTSKLSDKRTSAFGHCLEDNPEQLDEKKVKEAAKEMKKKRKEEKHKAAMTIDDERKRKYAGLADGGNQEVTAEELEAYRMTKVRSDDPMAKFL